MNIVISIVICIVVCMTGVVFAGGVVPDSLAQPDYSSDGSWARYCSEPEYEVDVFFVYPTVYAGSDILNMDINSKENRAKVEMPLNSQLSIFDGSANIFAPYYRQMSGALMSYKGDLSETEYFRIASGDVLAAFEYYIENVNNGRPFILAGHSQGSMLLIELLHNNLFKKKELSDRLVAAYLIGYTVDRNDPEKYPWMKFADSDSDTGVIISYNTESPDAENSPVLLDNAFCINPLNWSTGFEHAGKELNLGAVFFNSDGTVNREIKNYCGAEIDPESYALVTVPPEKLDVRAFPEGVYHIYDYAFWYRNLEENVKVRIKSYLDNQRKY